MNKKNTSTYRVRYSLTFQVATGSLGTYAQQIKEAAVFHSLAVL
jgi:hypothetical protein